MKLHGTPHAYRYYFNTVTKKASWTPPRFSANWESEKREREMMKGRRRASSWVATTNSSGGSGFECVFTNIPHKMQPWDFSQVYDPARVHGRFKVDSNDEVQNDHIFKK
jgi:hypothetical protein